MEEVKIEDMTDEEWGRLLDEVVNNELELRGFDFGKILFGEL